MSKCLLFLGLLVLFSLTASRGEPIYFLMGPLPGVPDRDSFVISLDKAEDIAHARDLIVHGPEVNGEPNQPYVFLKLVVGEDGINRDYLDGQLPEWSWHVSEVLGFADFVLGVPFPRPSQLEEYAQNAPPGQIITNAFASHTVVRELGPTPLYLSMVRSSNAVEIYWTDPGTNYLYTLEWTAALAATNWLSVPGGAWPAKTNHWTVLAPSAPQNYFRVRATQTSN